MYLLITLYTKIRIGDSEYEFLFRV